MIQSLSRRGGRRFPQPSGLWPCRFLPSAGLFVVGPGTTFVVTIGGLNVNPDIIVSGLNMNSLITVGDLNMNPLITITKLEI